MHSNGLETRRTLRLLLTPHRIYPKLGKEWWCVQSEANSSQVAFPCSTGKIQGNFAI